MSQLIINALNKLAPNTLIQTLDIHFISFNNNVLTAKMLVNSKVHQPYGILHGGATIALIETVGSIISSLQFKEEENALVLGTQLSVNHLNSVKQGAVLAKASIIRAGKTIHVVKVEVIDEKGKLISIATQTNTIKYKN